MKTKGFLMFICALGVCFNVQGENANESEDVDSQVKILTIDQDALQINCLSTEEFASCIGTKCDSINLCLQNLFQDSFDKVAKSKKKNDKQFLVEMDTYEVSASGYPYNNISHIINYSIYNENKNKIYSDSYRFATFSKMSQKDIQSQLKKLSKKILNIVNKE